LGYYFGEELEFEEFDGSFCSIFCIFNCKGAAGITGIILCHLFIEFDL
jgi:hypothetical protein